MCHIQTCGTPCIPSSDKAVSLTSLTCGESVSSHTDRLPAEYCVSSNTINKNKVINSIEDIIIVQCAVMKILILYST